MHLKSLTKGPPGGFRYTQPESGHFMKAITFNMLCSKVLRHRQNMRYRIVTEGFQTIGQEMEDYICHLLSPDDQVRNCKAGYRSRGSVPWQEVSEFIKTAAKWFVTGRRLVPNEEAERRAAICANCPLNVGMSGCASCRNEVNEFVHETLHRSTQLDERLQACGVCGCELKSTVHLPIDVLDAGGKHTFPEWCWRHKSA